MRPDCGKRLYEKHLSHGISHGDTMHAACLGFYSPVSDNSISKQMFAIIETVQYMRLLY
jgi:hypothetical protein